MAEASLTLRQALDQLDEAAAAVMLADPDHKPSVMEFLTPLEELAHLLKQAGLKDLRKRALAPWRVGRRLIDGTDDAQADLSEATRLIAELQEQLPGLWQGDESAATTPAPAVAPAPPAPVDYASPTWDDDILELMPEFLLESDEGLNECDAVLLDMEQSGATNKEGVNKLFRAFHTIKGTAGFLSLGAISVLAHRTENMLDLVRSDKLELSGVPLDLTFDSIALMRQLLDAAKEGMETRGAVTTADGHAELLAQLDSLLGGGTPPQPKARPAAAPRPTAPEPEQAPLPAARKPAAAKPPATVKATSGQGKKKKESTIKETIRVDLERVDALVELIGELVISEAMVANAPELDELASPRVQNLLAQLGKISRDLQDIGMRMRMVPLKATFQKMARMVRDVGRKAGKNVRVEITGEGTEMDRSMVEGLGDPLVHIIRNAVDHGVETSEQRVARGKDPVGVVRLRAYHESGKVVVEVADDGNGLDQDALIQRAVERGLIRSDAKLTDEEAYALIFAPGFSTAKQVTQISGRGVGMDVVRRNIEAMRGRVSISSERGEGSTFKLMLPLTLAIIDGMLVRCGDERYVLPTLSIIESVQPSAEQIGTQQGRKEFINLRGRVMPLFRLQTVLQIPGELAAGPPTLVVVVENNGRLVGLGIDEVLSQQQIVIKKLDTGFDETPFASGAAILPDGRVGVILDVDELVRLATRGGEDRLRSLPSNPHEAPQARV